MAPQTLGRRLRFTWRRRLGWWRRIGWRGRLGWRGRPVRMAAQRLGWGVRRRGVDRRAGLGPAAAGVGAGDRVAALWFGWR